MPAGVDTFNRLRLVRLRYKLRLQGGQLARRVGISRNQLSRYEHGHDKPTEAGLRKLAAALKVDPEELCGDDPYAGITPDERALIDAFRDLSEFWRGRLLGWVQGRTGRAPDADLSDTLMRSS